MSKSLEELRAQRELIKKHLDWLDSQIVQAEDDDKGYQTKLAEKTFNDPAPANDSLNQSDKETAESKPTANPRDDVGDKLMKPSSGSDIKRAQVGCFIFFAVITLLFLFLLFGLPYLLD